VKAKDWSTVRTPNGTPRTGSLKKLFEGGKMADDLRRNLVKRSTKKLNRANRKTSQLDKLRSDRPRGLSRRQRAFIREKVLGLNDKEAALAAGYSLSVSHNTKQKIWHCPGVAAEFERLRKAVRRDYIGEVATLPPFR
jgi:hypothetical protein